MYMGVNQRRHELFYSTLIDPIFDVESIGDGPRVPRAHLEVVFITTQRTFLPAHVRVDSPDHPFFQGMLKGPKNGHIGVYVAPLGPPERPRVPPALRLELATG